MFIEFENPLNASPLVFPVLEVLHILGFAVTLGTIAIVDFALLGLGMRKEPTPDIAKELAPWTLVGLGSIFISGPLLYISDPDMYYTNKSFLAKMVLLLLAIVFNYTIHRKAVSPGASGSHKLVACVSLALWMSVIAGGIFIAFV
jgi:Family of unknown function (DUF6644)